MNKQKRVLILTDSLGCPRDEICVDNTWTDRIIRKWTGNGAYFFYTYCEHGLAAKYLKMDYIKEIKPDIIICQIGICDASRRAFSKKIITIVSYFKVISRIINEFAKKHHYFLTRIKSIHYTSKVLFQERLKELSELSTKVLFIEIAPPGKFLVDDVYNIENDVYDYNSIIKETSDKYNKDVCNPYKDLKTEEFLLDDGHHLNNLGQEMLFNAVDSYLQDQK